MRAKNFIEVSLKTRADAGELLAELPQEGILGVWEQDGTVCLYWSEEQWNRSIQQAIDNAARRIGGSGRVIEPVVRVIADQDWNAAWAASLQPIRIGPRVRIRQSWHERDPQFEGVELIIDPKRAFGSGYHATTQLVIEWLQENVRSGMRVLDVGTGSGILAMVALRLGAASALGIDNDSAAVECAREMAAINGFGSELKLVLASFDELDGGDFDLVTANLDGRTLRRLCPLLPKFLNKGALACLSGFQREDYGELTGILNKSRLRPGACREREEWLALEVFNAA